MEFHLHRHLSGYAFTSDLTYDLVTTLATMSRIMRSCNYIVPYRKG